MADFCKHLVSFNNNTDLKYIIMGIFTEICNKLLPRTRMHLHNIVYFYLLQSRSL